MMQTTGILLLNDHLEECGEKVNVVSDCKYGSLRKRNPFTQLMSADSLPRVSSPLKF